jgi:hypothetical protein
MSSSTDTAVTIDRDYFDTLVRRYVSVLFGYQAMHMPPMIGWCPPQMPKADLRRNGA